MADLRSEIRDSEIRDLLAKVKRQDYGAYLTTHKIDASSRI